MSKPLIALVALLAVGCGDPYSNRWFDEDELFVTAVPRPGELVSDTPAPDRATRDIGQDAVAVGFTRDVVASVNGLNLWLLGLLDDVVQQPISTRSEDLRIWGPYSWPERFGRSVRLTVERVDEGAFVYVLSGQDALPRAVVEEAWVPLLFGRFDRVGDLRDGAGIFTYDAGAVSRFGASDATGTMTSEYTTDGGFVSLYSEFEGWSDGATDARDSDYSFERHRGGGGVFEFRTPAQVVGGAGSALETWRLRTRWRADKSGRADAFVVGGDLAARVPSVECWGEAGDRTYYRVGAAADPFEEEGRAVDCVLEQESPRDLRD